MREAHQAGALRIPARELPWLERMERVLEELPASETEFANQMLAEVDTTRFVAADYGLG
jgi:hypothetical protein